MTSRELATLQQGDLIEETGLRWITPAKGPWTVAEVTSSLIIIYLGPKAAATEQFHADDEFSLPMPMRVARSDALLFFKKL